IIKRRPVASGGFQQHVSTDDVGLDKLRRAADRAVNMGFGRQMHNRVRLVFTEYTIKIFTITDVDALERVALALLDGLERLKVASVSQLVDVDDRVARIGNDMTYDCRTDEASAACY